MVTVSSQRSDIVLALFVIAITAMLLIPLPTVLLDLLLVTNISFSLLLLLVGLYMPNALALLAFPSLLLLTTLYRLGLNVASTRLILSQGDAGRVIEAFGTFLIRGELVVGIIIFTIITIVNFIVIARGSARVSEVAARFALDALPGKQMAIDSDLRSGLISPQEAQRRRDDLRKESQLYGSMDGAMKFVQGDAIAGFFIIFTNIIGGLYLGISHGQSFSDAVHTYSVLTVGDGLVSQIPALLISICAGIVVTRVSSGENTTLGRDVGAQLFARPGTLLLSGIILVFIGFLPGLPAIPFLAVASMFVLGAYLLKRSLDKSATNFPAKLEYTGLGGNVLPGLPDVEESADEKEVVVTLDGATLFRMYKSQTQKYLFWWREFRTDFFSEIGIRLPELSVVADDLASPGSFSVSMGGAEVERGQVLLDCVLVEMNPESAPILGIDVVQEAEHPVNGCRVFWALQSASLRKVAESANIRTFDFMEFIGLRIASFVQRCPEEVLTLAEVHSLLRQLEKKHPGFVTEVLKREFMNVARLSEVLQELVREGLSIRDFKQVIEAIGVYCSTVGLTHVEDGEFDLEHVVSFIRTNRKRQLISKLLSGRQTLKVLTLSPELEETFEQAETGDNNGPLVIEPGAFDAIQASLQEVLGPLIRRGILPVSILCRNDIRHRVDRFIRNLSQAVRVVGFDELDSRVIVEQVGVWRVEGV